MKRISSASLKFLVLIIAIVSSVTSVVQARNELPPGQSQPSQATLIATVNVAKLNVRRAPRITSSIIGTYGKGEEILLIGRTQGSVWLQVSTDFGIGWIANGFATLSGSSRELPITTVIPPFLTVSALPSVNVRLGPSEEYDILTQLPRGVEVDVVGIHKRPLWYLVAMPDVGPIGFVRGDTVVVDGPTANLPEFARVPVLARVVSYRVRVHSEPTLASPTIATVRLATRYEVVGLDVRRNWWLIQGPFGRGWILAAYVNVFGSLDGLPSYETEPLRQ
jgi:uncharacterized protein YgiM (DUF1202 family)